MTQRDRAKLFLFSMARSYRGDGCSWRSVMSWPRKAGSRGTASVASIRAARLRDHADAKAFASLSRPGRAGGVIGNRAGLAHNTPPSSQPKKLVRAGHQHMVGIRLRALGAFRGNLPGVRAVFDEHQAVMAAHGHHGRQQRGRLLEAEVVRQHQRLDAMVARRQQGADAVHARRQVAVDFIEQHRAASASAGSIMVRQW